MKSMFKIMSKERTAMRLHFRFGLIPCNDNLLKVFLNHNEMHATFIKRKTNTTLSLRINKNDN